MDLGNKSQATDEREELGHLLFTELHIHLHPNAESPTQPEWPPPCRSTADGGEAFHFVIPHTSSNHKIQRQPAWHVCCLKGFHFADDIYERPLTDQSLIRQNLPHLIF